MQSEITPLTPRAPSMEASALRVSVRPAFGIPLRDLLLVVLAACFLRAPILHLSLFASSDESSFILAAREVVQGHLPYLTYWDDKPIGSTMLIAAAMTTFGQSIPVVRTLGTVCVIITACLLYLITRLAWPGRLIPLAVALLYVAFSVSLQGAATITEILLAPFTTAGILLLLLGPSRRSALGSVAIFTAAGLAFGIATWIKYVPAVPASFTGGVALMFLLLRRERSVFATLACGAGFATGLLLPTFTSIALYWWSGALPEFSDANFGFAHRYMAGLQDSPGGAVFYAFRETSFVVMDIWPLLAISVVAFFPTCRRYILGRGRACWGVLILAWLAGEILAVAGQMKFYHYHFLLLLPPLCAIASIAIGVYANHLVKPSKVVLASLLVLGFLMVGPAVVHLRAAAAELSHPDVPREIANRITAEWRPGDSVFVANYEPIIYFLARAPLPTRDAFSPNLLGSHRSLIPDDPHSELRRILNSRPKFVVINQTWRDHLVTWDPQMMTEIEHMLAHDYIKRAEWKLPDSNSPFSNAPGVAGLFVRLSVVSSRSSTACSATTSFSARASGATP